MNERIEHTVIFLHIPKASGSTLTRIIERQYDPDCIYKGHTTEGIKAFKRLLKPQRMKIKMFIGHVAFGFHKYLASPYIYFTLLRDPVERVISHYYYVQRRPDHYLRPALKSGNMNLQQYVASGVSPELDNGQTKLLAGLEYEKLYFGEYGSELLEQAKANLRQHFAVVGTTERFDETLILLQKTFGWRIPFYTRVNVSNNRMSREDLSSATLETIKKFNELDIELYDYAQTLLDEQINRQSFNIDQKVRNFIRLNQLYGFGHRSYRALTRRINAIKVEAL